MGFLLAVLSFVVAEEVVELEPVKASPTNHYGCNTHQNENACDNDAYCYWAAGATNNNKRCIDDPCLKYNPIATGSCPESSESLDGGVGVITCTKRQLSNYGGHDCSGFPGSGSLCTQNAKDKTNLYTYCEYTQLKDDSCPDSICMEKIGSTDQKKHCVKNDVAASDSNPCRFLTETDCSLIPKCYWTSGKCEIDICFQKRPSSTACEHILDNPLWKDAAGNNIAIADKTCTEFHPYSYQDGSVLDYCIHKDNAKANICYFGNLNITNGDLVSPTDHGSDWSANWSNKDGTYPTYNYGTADPDCATDGLSHCEGHGECKTIVNLKGAFAGKYCTDGKHAAANILRIPSLLVFLVVFLGAMFSL